MVETDEKKAQRLDEEIKDLNSLVHDQDRHLQNLLNTSFQLANYYFVFQGVIVAAISNAKSLTCKDRWFPFTLSLLASILNLCALLVSGNKYINGLRERHTTWSLCNQKSAEKLLNQVTPRQLDEKNVETRDIVTEKNVETRDIVTEKNVETRDIVTEKRHQLLFVLCILFFLGVAAVTLVGCWRIMCNHHDNCMCEGVVVDNYPNCIKICVGSKCMKYCH